MSYDTVGGEGLVIQVMVRFCNNLGHLMKVFVLGGSDSGKTKLAQYIVTVLKNHPEFRESEVRWLEAPSKKSAITAMLTPTDRNCVMVFDDVSFILEGTSREMNVFKNLEARVRHVVIPEDKKLVLIYCTHYAYSISPFLRECDYVMLTGLKLVQIRKFSMDNELGSYFSESELRQFYHLCVQVRSATKAAPNFRFMDKEYDSNFFRPLIVSGDDKFITIIKKQQWDERQPYRWYPPNSLNETLSQVETKFGKDYRKEIEEILSEATISHRKRAGEDSEYFG